ELPPIDEQELAKAINDVVRQQVLADATRRGFLLACLLGARIEAFATEAPDRLALTFQLTYRLLDGAPGTENAREDARVTVNGDCFYDETARVATGAMVDQLLFEWVECGNAVSAPTYFNSCHGELSAGGGYNTPFRQRYRINEPIYKTF